MGSQYLDTLGLRESIPIALIGVSYNIQAWAITSKKISDIGNLLNQGHFLRLINLLVFLKVKFFNEHFLRLLFTFLNTNMFWSTVLFLVVTRIGSS